jgi:hypothetical protein
LRKSTGATATRIFICGVIWSTLLALPEAAPQGQHVERVTSLHMDTHSCPRRVLEVD